MEIDAGLEKNLTIQLEEKKIHQRATDRRENEDETENESSVGVAFSGGGIRSAAFASGVLRRLLQKKVPMSYMSCVSGGGYTGSAYLEWKYRKDGADDPKWHEKFFNHMRRNASSQCNWRNPIQGLCDSLFVVLMMLFVVFLIPALIWIPIAFPLAYLCDYFFGDILRQGFICKGHYGFNYTTLSEVTSIKITANGTSNCFPLKERESETKAIFFSCLAVGIIISYSFSKIASCQMRHFFELATGVVSVLLAFTFLPWFFELYLASVPFWLKVVVLALGVILWMGVPPLRSKASWTLLIYVYSYEINYRVYRNPVLGIAYNDTYFMIVTWASTGFLLLAPFLSIIQKNCLHSFYRCKLQKAFYTRKSSGLLGCAGISCGDFFPLTTSFVRRNYEEIEGDIHQDKETLTIKDLAHLRPHYICNMLVDNWIYENSSDPATAFTVLTISPTLIERIDDDENKDFDENSIGPEDVKLSDAMATSGAVVSYHMGGYKNEAALSLQMMLGLTMGKSWISDKRLLKTTFCGALVPYLIQIVLFSPILLMPLADLNQWLKFTLAGYFLMGIFIAFLLFLVIIAIMTTGRSRTSRVENFVRWCIVNIYQVRFLRETLMISNIGEVPPPILYLSDGGHVENLGLLALLKLRLRKIVVTDGGFKENNGEYGLDLLHSLEMARKKLRCSFTGMDGRDILEDLRDKFVEPIFQKYPRHYRFKVHYYDKDEKSGETTKVGEGEVLFLAPRHPDEGIASVEEQNSWAEYEAETGISLKKSRWGQGPVLSSHEADRLTGLCCGCCHSLCCMTCSKPLLGRFPQHSTANQLFTAAMFSAYHREGFRALVEGTSDGFLKT